MKTSTVQEDRKTVVVFKHGDENNEETHTLQMFDKNFTPEAATQMIFNALGEGKLKIVAILHDLSCQDAATIALIDQEVDSLQVTSRKELQQLLSFSIPSPVEPKRVRQTLYDDITDPESIFREYIKGYDGGSAIDHITEVLYLYVMYGDAPSKFTQKTKQYADNLTPNERSILLMIFHVLMQKALPMARE